jgi:hypothetical protein
MKKSNFLVAVLSTAILTLSSTVSAQAVVCTATDSENIRKILFEQGISAMSGDLEPLFGLIEKARKKTKSKKLKIALTKLETKLEEEGSISSGGDAFKVIIQLQTMRDYKRC